MPDDKKVHARAGYFVKPSLCKWIVFAQNNAGPFEIGETLCSGIDTVMQKAFREKIKLSSLDDVKSQNVDLIVIPEIVNFNDINLYRNPGFGKSSLVVKIKWTVQDKEKDILFVQTITGEVEGTAHSRWGLQELMEKGLQDHFQKALESLLAQDWDSLLKEAKK